MILYGQIPEVVGKYKGKRLLVCGSARCLWDDIRKVKVDDFDVMVINSAGLYFPYRITHWFSGYYESLEHLRKIRYYEFGNHFKPKEIILTHSRFYYPGVDCVWKAEAYGYGTSTLDACSVGLLMGYEQVVIAGAPLDNTMHFYDPPWLIGKGNDDCGWEIYFSEWKLWNERYFQGRVKSLSGKTKEICGGYDGEVIEIPESGSATQSAGSTETQDEKRQGSVAPFNGEDGYPQAGKDNGDSGYIQKDHEERQVIHGPAL